MPMIYSHFIFLGRIDPPTVRDGRICTNLLKFIVKRFLKAHQLENNKITHMCRSLTTRTGTCGAPSWAETSWTTDTGCGSGTD